MTSSRDDHNHPRGAMPPALVPAERPEAIVLQPGAFVLHSTLLHSPATVLTASTGGGTLITLPGPTPPVETGSSRPNVPIQDGRFGLAHQRVPLPYKYHPTLKDERPTQATISLCLNHAPFARDRARTLDEMLSALELHDGRGPKGPFWVHDIDYRKGGTIGKEERVDFTLNQWRWAVQQPTTHHAFATDDLKLVPRFWDVLDAMLQVTPYDVVGLLSNHPKAPALAADHHRWYATNSWVVGPMYVLPHHLLVALLNWPGTYVWDAKNHGWSDDATLNAWVKYGGTGRTLHPLPTPIEHDPERLMSTWSHTGCGDEYSRERLSWRKYATQQHLDEAQVAEDMRDPNFWRGGAMDAPVLVLPGQE